MEIQERKTPINTGVRESNSIGRLLNTFTTLHEEKNGADEWGRQRMEKVILELFYFNGFNDS